MQVGGAGLVAAQPVGRPVDAEDDARCRSRSSMAAVTIGSPSRDAHDATPRFVVSMMLPLRWRWVMTWNSAATASSATLR